MNPGKASGIQVAFLILATLLLTVPVVKYLIPKLALDLEWAWLAGKLVSTTALAVLMLLLWRLDREFVAGLFKPIPSGKRLEVATVAVIKLLQPFAFFGALALWFWFAEGPISLENRVETWRDVSGEAAAFAWTGIFGLALAVLAAPLIEEAIFRGVLYSAWKVRWGWILAALFTSAVFAFYHQAFASAFVSSMIYVCLFRRTGTLLAPIVVHASFNASTWHPFLGQFYLPTSSQAAGDLSAWSFHVACLAMFVVTVPLYLVISHREFLADRDP